MVHNVGPISNYLALRLNWRSDWTSVLGAMVRAESLCLAGGSEETVQKFVLTLAAALLTLLMRCRGCRYSLLTRAGLREALVNGGVVVRIEFRTALLEVMLPNHRKGTAAKPYSITTTPGKLRAKLKHSPCMVAVVKQLIDVGPRISHTTYSITLTNNGWLAHVCMPRAKKQCWSMSSDAGRS